MGIESITTALERLFTSIRKPAAIIPAITILCSALQRPGLSAIISLANIAKDLAKEGINTEPGPDGTPNKTLKFTNAVVKEVYRAIVFDGRVESAIFPGGVNVTTMGANAGGPMTSTGGNIMPVKTVGVFH